MNWYYFHQIHRLQWNCLRPLRWDQFLRQTKHTLIRLRGDKPDVPGCGEIRPVGKVIGVDVADVARGCPCGSGAVCCYGEGVVTWRSPCSGGAELDTEIGLNASSGIAFGSKGNKPVAQNLDFMFDGVIE
ncbi:hypothetical protein JTB14_037760 [Gonioctena quinquepunctata]|nr:hypothetical protein JTB14_037760 [Gonioctena quinquepunctata]